MQKGWLSCRANEPNAGREHAGWLFGSLAPLAAGQERPLGLELALAVGPRAARKSMHGPDEAGPGVQVLSGLSAGAGQLSEAGPVRVIKVEQPGGPEHRRR